MIWLRQRTWIFIAALTLSWLLSSVVTAAEDSTTTLLQARFFPVKGPTDDLQPQILDFRYALARWQACIGLPDDPYKSIVGSDGGLYYQYGGGPYYDFRMRVLAELKAEGQKSKIRQSLWSPRIPIIIAEQDIRALALCQEAWAGAPEGEDIQQWSSQCVDYQPGVVGYRP